MYPVSANSRERISKRGGRKRAHARSTGTKYDANPESPRLDCARRELRSVAGPVGPLHLHRPPLAVELARDGIECAGRSAAAGRGVEDDVGMDQRLPL